jgi:hypothetical protein
MNYKMQIKTFWALLYQNVVIYKKNLFSRLVNCIFWANITVAIFAYIMPRMGVQNLGFFMLITNVLSTAFWNIFHGVGSFLSEINDPQSRLCYELTLPIHQSLIFIKYALTKTYQAFILSFLTLPGGLLLIWNQVNLQYFYFIKFWFVCFFSCTCGASLLLVVVAYTADLHYLDSVFSRVIGPLWLLGGANFYWYKLYEINKTLAYINLANPITYMFEGARAVTMHTIKSLPYSICIVMLIAFTIIFSWWGVIKLRKRLDCL